MLRQGLREAGVESRTLHVDVGAKHGAVIHMHRLDGDAVARDGVYADVALLWPFTAVMRTRLCEFWRSQTSKTSRSPSALIDDPDGNQLFFNYPSENASRKTARD